MTTFRDVFEDIHSTIEALRSKTVERGATEHEARSAKAKADELERKVGYSNIDKEDRTDTPSFVHNTPSSHHEDFSSIGFKYGHTMVHGPRHEYKRPADIDHKDIGKHLYSRGWKPGRIPEVSFEKEGHSVLVGKQGKNWRLQHWDVPTSPKAIA